MKSDWRQREEDLTVTHLGRLLARMALDENLHRQYLEHPNKVIANAGLSAEEKKALHDGAWDAIVRLVGPRPRPLPKEPSSGGGG